MSVSILGVKIDVLSKKEVWEKIDELLASGSQHQVATVNPEFILAAQKDEQFRDILNRASLSVVDGMGIRIMGWLKGFIVPEIVTGTDLIGEILDFRLRVSDCGSGDRVFLLGGYSDIPEVVAQRLKKKYDSCEFDHSVFEALDIIDKINNFKPNILFVAVSHPKAQKWIDKNLPKMPSVRIAMGVGGAFDYLAGKVRRAPQWMRKMGLEWLFRLMVEPKKRLKRIWGAVVVFPIKVIMS